MKKNEKNHVLQFEKMYFIYCYFLATPLSLQSLRRRSNNILNHSKWRKNEKDLPKVFGHRLVFGRGHVYTTPQADDSKDCRFKAGSQKISTQTSAIKT